MNSNQISDASKPSKFSKLSQLRLDGDSIENIEPLSNLVELEVLTLNNNKIKDISCLGNLKKLEELEAGNNEIEDINVIRNFEKLERLIMPGNKIIDVSPMDGSKVEDFNFDNNRIFDFSKYKFNYVMNSGCNNFGYYKLFARNQDVTLNIVVCNNVAKIKLPTLNHPDESRYWNIEKDYDKPEVYNISDGGVYDRKTGTITWDNITEDKKVNFEVKHNFPLENPWEPQWKPQTYVFRSFEYSGKVDANIRVLSLMEDNNMMEAVLSALGKPQGYMITKEDLEGITELDLSSKNITSFKGLEYCTNLKSLSLSGNNIKDIKDVEGIENLKGLEHLNLSNNNIENIDNVGNLETFSNLTELNLSNNNIKDISSLKIPDSLKTINLEDQSITLDRAETDKDFALNNPIKGVTETNVIDIYNINEEGVYNKEEDSIEWKNVKQGTTLKFDFKSDINYKNTNINFSGKVSKDLSVSAIDLGNSKLEKAILETLGYKYLTKGILESTTSLSLSNFDILEKLTNLEVLNLERASIRDITPLSKLNKLRNLDFLSNLKNLKVLLLKDDRHLSDISPIKNLTNLKYLSLEGSLPDISSLSSLKNLEYLNLGLEDYWGDSLDWKWKLDIDCLKGLDNLKELHLNRTEIHDYSSLKGLTNLKLLSLNRSCIGSNLNESIKELKNLDTLELKSCNLNDIECLKDLTNVKKLGIAYNIVTDISPISTMIGLEELDISGNKGQNRSLKDIKALELCNNLKVLRCTTTEDIPKEQFDSLQKVNPNLKIDKHALQKW